MHRRGGVIMVLSEKILSHSAKKFRGDTFQCFRKFWVSKNIMHKKRISLFSVETFFCLTVPKKFVGEALFQENFGIEKFHA